VTREVRESAARADGFEVAIDGLIAPGFEGVLAEFDRNFSERGELGASFAAYKGEQCLVDLWGGLATPRPTAQQWKRETLQLIFSGTKGLVATCILVLVDRGQIELSAPVTRYWPEFGANGKESVTVAEVVSHRAAMPGIRTPLSERDLLDGRRLADLLAAQAPESDPRAGRAYHALTYGWLCGELIRRVDGRNLGIFFQEEIAEPLGLEVWIGLPPEQESRVSTLVYDERWSDNPIYDEERLAADDLLRSIWGNPRFLGPGHLPWNTREFHAAEIPGGNAIATARSVARLYSCLAGGGELGGVRLLGPDTARLGRQELHRFNEVFTNEPCVYGVGFQLQAEESQFGSPPEAFGHTGAGGSVHGAWPNEAIGFSYAMNDMRDEIDGDPRSDSLLRALFEAIA